jgi:hypothetical protein
MVKKKSMSMFCGVSGNRAAPISESKAEEAQNKEAYGFIPDFPSESQAQHRHRLFLDSRLFPTAAAHAKQGIQDCFRVSEAWLTQLLKPNLSHQINDLIEWPLWDDIIRTYSPWLSGSAEQSHAAQPVL